MSYSYSLSLPPPSSLATIKLANPGSPGKWPLKRRELATAECEVHNCHILQERRGLNAACAPSDSCAAII